MEERSYDEIFRVLKEELYKIDKEIESEMMEYRVSGADGEIPTNYSRMQHLENKRDTILAEISHYKDELEFEKRQYAAKSKRIFLVRHGESESNVHYRENIGIFRKIRVYGQSNWCELTEVGKIQSKALGKHLKQYFKENNLNLDKIYSSPAIRAQQTARHVFNQLYPNRWVKYEIRAEIAEIDQGDWEGQFDYKARPPRIKEQIKNENWFHKPPRGESQQDVYERFMCFIIEILKSDYKNILVVTHENAIKFLLTGIFKWDKENAFRLKYPLASSTVLECYKGVFKILKIIEISEKGVK